VVKGKISDFLDEKPQGLDVDELAKLSGIHAAKLLRIMRFLVTKHIYEEGQISKFIISLFVCIPTQPPI
jgi:DNA-binding IclR family transcriptional regulator